MATSSSSTEASSSSPMAASSTSPSMAAIYSSLSSFPSPSMAEFQSCASLSSPTAISPSSPLSPPMVTPEKKILIECANSQITEVYLTVALQSEILADCLKDNSVIVEGHGRIQVPEVTKPVFDKAMKYCELKLKADNSPDDSKEKEDFRKFEVHFIQELQNLDTLYDLIEAANTLRIDSLLDQTCQCVANMMNGKTVAQVREIFNIENDYTPEEEAVVRKEYTWIFEN